jgi:phasin family protein
LIDQKGNTMARKTQRSRALAKSKSPARKMAQVKPRPSPTGRSVSSAAEPVLTLQKFNPVINFMEMKMTKNPSFDKVAQDAASFGQEQMEAFVKSTTIFSKGMESVMKTCMEMAQSSAEKAQTAAKTMMTCKTINEVTEAQTKFAQASFDDFMNGATKISEMTVKVASECMEPINGQFGKAMKKASQAA